MISTNDINTLLESNTTVYSSDGDKIGGIGQVYLDDQTGEPSFATVKTGLFGTSETFVPLADAAREGDDLRVPYTKDQVKDAPRVEADASITPEEEEELYRHYNMGGTGTTTRDQGDTDRETEATFAGNDAPKISGDDTMTRSEERLNVGTEKVESGRMRLRKHVVTENVTTTVPVSREEVVLERVPVTGENRGDAINGAEIGEEEHEIVLHEERPVVEKETVAVEQVRLGTKTVTEDKTVTGEVRKEQITTDGDDIRDNR